MPTTSDDLERVIRAHEIGRANISMPPSAPGGGNAIKSMLVCRGCGAAQRPFRDWAEYADHLAQEIQRATPTAPPEPVVAAVGAEPRDWAV